ncbi:MAG: carbamoyltransferase HypF [Vulcanimicrobiota bacterium]
MSNEIKHMKLNIEGVVQGVGFRPHVYNLARSMGFTGNVLNDSRGVTIELEGPESALEIFKTRLLKHPPPLAIINDFSIEISEKLSGYTGFVIKKSGEGDEKKALISPDVATCPDCLEELFVEKDPRYKYPFINCTNCGPRFTIINDVPYDRHNTSMKDFKLCPFCRGEYEDPGNRRFHGQPVGCAKCGPRLLLLDNHGNEIETRNIIDKACEILGRGRIIAVKGLGGFHLTVDATNENAVKRLRKRKARDDKPFAVMARDLQQAHTLCLISKEGEESLGSFRAPIVLLKKRKGINLACSVAPDNKYLGIMLPYTPLHHLLLRKTGNPLVMTSGNLSNEPICHTNQEALSKLSSVADYFLLNDRPIVTRCDDSVIKIVKKEEFIIRRSRGYAPYPVSLKEKAPISILAVGGQLKNTFSLYKGDKIFPGFHIGDLENPETLNSFKQGIELYKKLFQINPEAIAYDLHPAYLSTGLALKSQFKNKIGIQHHHAHIGAVMAECDIQGPVIGVVLDGLGYGEDGKLRGFEILLAEGWEFKRLANLDFIPMPGGEEAIRQPWRLAVSYLYKTFGSNLQALDLPFLQKIEPEKIRFIIQMIEKRLNSPVISSAGRLFDAVSSLVNLGNNATFEAQPAIKLEMASDETETESYEFEFKNEGNITVIKPEIVIRSIVKDLSAGVDTYKIGGKFHNSVVKMITCVISKMARTYGLDRIILAGGAFQNTILINKTLDQLKNLGYKTFVNRHLPVNDGGISVGQAFLAARKLRGF